MKRIKDRILDLSLPANLFGFSLGTPQNRQDLLD